MKKVIVFSILACLAMTGAAKVNLYVVLDKVAVQPNVKGAVKVGEDREYSDALIGITWDARPDGFYFQLTSKTNGKLVIPWDECRFVDETGANCAVVHDGVGAALEIEPKGSVNSVVAPTDYFYWTKKGWMMQNIFQDSMTEEEFEAIKDKDLVYTVIFPVRRDKVKTVYHFIFKTVAR